MKNIIESILNRVNDASESSESLYIKKILFIDERDFNVWPDGSIYTKGNILIFDFDKLDEKYKKYKIYKPNFTGAIKELDIQEIIFKGSKITHMEIEGHGYSFNEVKLINKSTAEVAFSDIFGATGVEGDIFFKQKWDYYFTNKDSRNTGVFQARIKGYLHMVNANMEPNDRKRVKGMDPKDVLIFINENFGIPEDIHFNLGGDLHFINGIRDRKELNKFKFYGITPKDFIPHPEIEELYYCVN